MRLTAYCDVDFAILVVEEWTGFGATGADLRVLENQVGGIDHRRWFFLCGWFFLRRLNAPGPPLAAVGAFYTQAL